MKQFLIISIGVVVAVGIVLLIVFKLLLGGTTELPGPSDSINLNGGSTSPSNSTSVGTSGTQPSTTPGTVVVKDFKSDPALVKDEANPGYYYLGYHFSFNASDTTASKNPPYVIEYIDTTNYFNISLLQEPIAGTRQDAEQYLMQHLGISQSDMCQLKYMVSVPSSVNQVYAGQNLGFSFCPGATKL